jgi:hypothetical protein
MSAFLTFRPYPFVCVCVAWMITARMASAQAGTATITGTVTDSSNQPVPGVSITVSDPATGFERVTTTNSTGNYSLPGLRPASYDVTAELEGFRKHTQFQFKVEVDQVARLNIRLEVGQLAEAVEVRGTTPLLQTENSTIAAVIDKQKIVDLPLNGRNFVQLALLVPGANTGQPGAGRGGGISIGGTRSEQNSFQLDGMSNTAQWDSGISFRPSVEAIEEFKIEVSNYSAEFGRGAGGQINVVTRSGTNAFHGALYEFNRNDALQARNLFDLNPNFVDSQGRFKPPPLNRNEFGGVLGGPIVRNRTLFFADYQGTRQVRGSVGRRSVPDAALRSGDFSAVLGRQLGTDALGRPVFANQIFDPRTSRTVFDARTGRPVVVRDPFPGNRIPMIMFDPVALAVLRTDLWPATNVQGTRDSRTGNPRDNYFDDRPNRSNSDQLFLRIDQHFGNNDSFLARYGINDSDSSSPGNFPGNERLDLNLQQVFGASWTRVIGSTKVNELRFGYQRERPESGGRRILNGVNLVRDLGITGLPLAGPGAPVFSVAGFTTIDDGGESRRLDQTFQAIDQFSFSKGRHFFKVGGEVRRITLDVVNNPSNTRGQWDFGNAEWTGLEGFAGTGNTFANFLLGLPRQKSRRPGDHSSLLTATEYAAYVQDDFKVGSKLTINYGTRYQLYIPPKETRDHISSIRIAQFPASFAEGGIYLCRDPQRCASIDPSLPALSLGLTPADLYVDRLPEIVLAGRDVPRSLVGVEKFDLGPRVGVAYRVTPETVVRSGYGLFFDTVPISYFQDTVENLPWVREDQQSLSAFQFGLPPAEAFIGYRLNDPPIGSFTPGPNTYDVDFKHAYVHHWNVGVQRQLSRTLVAEVTYIGHHAERLNRRENLNTAEPRSPNASIPATVHPQLRRLFPFALFDGELIVLDNWFATTSTAYSTHHSLNTRFEKRFSRGLTFINSFTYGRTMSDAQPFSGGNNDTGNRIQDIFNKKADDGRAANDHRFRYVGSFLYELPFGRGRHFGGSMAPTLDHVIGGWQVNGIVTMQSGFPITILRSGDPLGVGTDGAARPDQICDPNLPRSEQTLKRFFNTDCFVAPPNRFGTAGRSSVEGPGTHVWDLSVFKNIAIGRGIEAQVRGEFFNAFNRPNWGQPGRTLGASGFGEVTSAGDPRIIQLGIKLLF